MWYARTYRETTMKKVAELEITVGHQTISDHFMLLSDQRTVWSAIVSKQHIHVWQMRDLYTCYSVNLLSLGAEFLCAIYMYLFACSLVRGQALQTLHTYMIHFNLCNVRSKSNNGRTKFTMLGQIHWTYLSYYFQLWSGI